ncbi:hydroxyacylglutathione hydrolase [Leptolyngbya sp. CCNP1308]|uniref:hydroxyacylglutathione hydrolase n=1 Tax=Leptolyngbya sp. CCNP1308 TaxID=3110255 RepID=UPI002B1F9FA5|nr:hydroxyacylglutathione hydrolase [Leptolyngbya sp. CCNP1308]MEA5447704.1 hydroxyacylglutathione hydrolase [Leptolyngbya sp. CCNP1308]
MEIHRIAAFRDNYIFVLHDAVRGQAAVVDPGDAQPVLQTLEELGATLTAILNTHHHSDHVGGNRQLLERFPQAQVYGGVEDRGRIPGQTHFLREGDRVPICDGQAAIDDQRTADVIFVPGHTRAHIAYYLAPATPNDWGELFCGDTLFAGGCGRLFEGSPQQMVESLGKLRQLPDTTRVWCAHEYTLNNLRFAVTIDGTNATLQQRLTQVQAARAQDQPTVPATLGLEKQTNPFLRWDNASLQRAMNSTSALQTFARLRGKKDQF